MATERRPGPPIPRVPAPQVKPQVPASAPPTRRAAVRPATGRKPVTARKTTRVDRPGGTSRGIPVRKKSNKALLFGGIGGGVLLLIIIIAVAVSSGSKKEPVTPKAKAAGGRPVDVAGLEREGERKCEEGLGVVQKSEALMSGKTLSAGESTQLKNDLQRAITLISDGMSMFDEANGKSGHMYDTTRYTNALKAARMKLGELGGR